MSIRERKTAGARSIPATVVTLDGGFRLAEAVNPDGTMAFWFMVPKPAADVPRVTPDHEKTGTLPKRLLVALGRTCGAQTRHGGPCQNVVPTFGDKCPSHRGKPLAAPSGPEDKGTLF